MNYIHFGVNTELLVFIFLLLIPHVLNQSHDCNNMDHIHVVVPKTLMCSSRVILLLEVEPSAHSKVLSNLTCGCPSC